MWSVTNYPNWYNVINDLQPWEHMADVALEENFWCSFLLGFISAFFSLFLPRKFLCSVYLHRLTFLDSLTPKTIPYGQFYGWLYCDKGQVCILCTLRHFWVHIRSYNFQSQFLLAEFTAIIILLLSTGLVTVVHCMPVCVSVKGERDIGLTPSFESCLVSVLFTHHYSASVKNIYRRHLKLKQLSVVS